MKKIVYALMVTVSGIVLLFSYRTSLGASLDTVETAADTAPAAVPPATGSGSSSGGSATSGSSPSSSPTASGSSGSSSSGSSSSSSSSSTSTGLHDGVFTGQAASTRFGDVQVEITVSGGRITDVQVPTYPSENGRDQQINSTAIPRLIDATLTAQSANISMVSGATYTSRGYQSSLQSALDQATS